MANRKKNNKAHILFRYGIVAMTFFAFGILIMFKLFQTTVVEASDWNKRARAELSRMDTIAPERGNILSDNGSILACNLKVFDIKLDLRHDKIRRMKVIPWSSIDSLADSLDRHYPRIANLLDQPADTIKKYSWHTRLKKEFEKPDSVRPRALRLAQKKGQEDYDKIKGFPFLKDIKGRHPLYKETRNSRIYPFGKMPRALSDE